MTTLVLTADLKDELMTVSVTKLGCKTKVVSYGLSLVVRVLKITESHKYDFRNLKIVDF